MTNQWILKVSYFENHPLLTFSQISYHIISYYTISYHLIPSHLISTLHSPGHPQKPHVSRHKPGFTEPTICSWPAGTQWCMDGWTEPGCLHCQSEATLSFVGTRRSSSLSEILEYIVSLHFISTPRKNLRQPLPSLQMFIVTHLNHHAMCISKLATPKVARFVHIHIFMLPQQAPVPGLYWNCCCQWPLHVHLGPRQASMTSASREAY